MANIKFGQTENGKPFNFPIDAATQTFAFIARKGAGKTYAAGKLTEGLLDAKVQVVVLDAVGNWYGLRIMADGSQGYDIPVLGGLRGDIPLDAAGGELIADIIVDTGRSVIIDISQFSKADRQRFCTAMGERLWKRKKGEHHPSPLHLVIEEAQLIIPQMVTGDAARMVGIFEEIVRLGRNYGIGVSMITQRPQSVNKEVLTQTECLVVLQTNGVPERKALKDWVVQQGMDVDLVNALPSLPQGTGFVWSPQWLGLFERVKIGQKQTVDASSTPKVGEKRISCELKPLDLGELQTRMKEIIEQKKADDPKALRAELAKLKQQLTTRPVESKQVEVEKRVEVAVLRDGQLNRIDSLAAKLEEQGAKLLDEAKAIRETIKPVFVKTVSAIRQSHSPHNVAALPMVIHKASAGVEADTSLSPCDRALLIAMAQHPSGLNKGQICTYASYSPSGTTAESFSKFNDNGWMEKYGSLFKITQAGLNALGEFDPLPTGKDLRDKMVRDSSPCEAAILNVLFHEYPDGMSKTDICEKAGYAPSGTTADVFAKLSRLNWMDKRGNQFFASSDLFE